MNDQTLLTHVRDRYPSGPPSVNRVISEFRVGYQQARRVIESAFGPIVERPRKRRAHR